MKNAPSYKALLKKFNAMPDEIREYFGHLPGLIEKEFPYEVALGYIFLRTELAQNRILYCGVLKLHHAHKDIVQMFLQNSILRETDFLNYTRTSLGKHFRSQYPKT